MASQPLRSHAYAAAPFESAPPTPAPLTAAPHPKSSDWRADLQFAARWFNAWWEGYAFDAEEERARIAVERLERRGGRADAIAELLWGEGRLDPGDAPWTMRHARTLGLPLRAKVAVMGAGRGAPLADLRVGTKWRARGFARRGVKRGRYSVVSYDEAATKLRRAWADGALCFFELHKDNDQTAFGLFVGEQLKPRAPAAFTDFTGARRGVRLRACFRDPLRGALRSVDETIEALERGGLHVSEAVDETQAFLPRITQGWARWRAAYNLALRAPSASERAATMRALATMADVWAERIDALRAGQMQVTRINARRY
ncbi:MAG: hypothetical protein ACFB00_14320 [Parvularculaceae bacterium]